MSLAASIVWNINPADDERVPGLQSMKIEAVPDSERQRFGRSRGVRTRLRFNGSGSGGGGGDHPGSGQGHTADVDGEWLGAGC